MKFTATVVIALVAAVAVQGLPLPSSPLTSGAIIDHRASLARRSLLSSGFDGLSSLRTPSMPSFLKNMEAPYWLQPRMKLGVNQGKEGGLILSNPWKFGRGRTQHVDPKKIKVLYYDAYNPRKARVEINEKLLHVKLPERYPTRDLGGWQP